LVLNTPPKIEYGKRLVSVDRSTSVFHPCHPNKFYKGILYKYKVWQFKFFFSVDSTLADKLFSFQPSFKDLAAKGLSNRRETGEIAHKNYKFPDSLLDNLPEEAFKLPPASEAPIISPADNCGCGGKCATSRCACFATGSQCGDACKCKGGCQNTFNGLKKFNVKAASQCFTDFVRKCGSLQSAIDRIEEEVIAPSKRRKITEDSETPVLSIEQLIARNSNSYFSFCTNRVEEEMNTHHCPTCHKCTGWRTWHCQRCDKCTYGVNLPCSNCHPHKVAGLLPRKEYSPWDASNSGEESDTDSDRELNWNASQTFDFMVFHAKRDKENF